MRDAAGGGDDAGDSSARLWTASFSSAVASASSRLIPVAAWDGGLHTSAQHCVDPSICCLYYYICCSYQI